MLIVFLSVLVIKGIMPLEASNNSSAVYLNSEVSIQQVGIEPSSSTVHDDQIQLSPSSILRLNTSSFQSFLLTRALNTNSITKNTGTQVLVRVSSTYTPSLPEILVKTTPSFSTSSSATKSNINTSLTIQPSYISTVAKFSDNKMISAMPFFNILYDSDILNLTDISRNTSVLRLDWAEMSSSILSLTSFDGFIVESESEVMVAGSKANTPNVNTHFNHVPIISTSTVFSNGIQNTLSTTRKSSGVTHETAAVKEPQDTIITTLHPSFTLNWVPTSVSDSLSTRDAAWNFEELSPSVSDIVYTTVHSRTTIVSGEQLSSGVTDIKSISVSQYASKSSLTDSFRVVPTPVLAINRSYLSGSNFVTVVSYHETFVSRWLVPEWFSVSSNMKYISTSQVAISYPRSSGQLGGGYIHVLSSSQYSALNKMSKEFEGIISILSLLIISDSTSFSPLLETRLTAYLNTSTQAVEYVHSTDTFLEERLSSRGGAEYATPTPSVVTVPAITDTVYLSSSVTHMIQIMFDVKLIFEFEGDCDRLILNAKLQNEFLQALIDVVLRESSVHIPKDHMRPENFNCHPFQVNLVLENLDYKTFAKLTEGNLTIVKVPILDDASVIEYEVKSVQVIPMPKKDSNKSTEMKNSLEKADIIIILVAGVLFGFLLCMCVVIGCKECYRRRRADSFNLLDVPHVNLDMEDFTLTKIPRPRMIYSENNSIINDNANQRPKHLSVFHGNSSETCQINADTIDTIQVRIQPHPEGVVVGLTCTPPRSPTKDSPPSEHSSTRSGASDFSKRALLQSNQSQYGLTNPNFEDEELNGIESQKYVVKEDDVEALL